MHFTFVTKPQSAFIHPFNHASIQYPLIHSFIHSSIHSSIHQFFYPSSHPSILPSFTTSDASLRKPQDLERSHADIVRTCKRPITDRCLTALPYFVPLKQYFIHHLLTASTLESGSCSLSTHKPTTFFKGFHCCLLGAVTMVVTVSTGARKMSAENIFHAPALFYFQTNFSTS